MIGLWHEDTISILPDAQLLHLHRWLCGLRGNGYGRSKRLAYVWRHPYRALYRYHVLVMQAMKSRGWKPAAPWMDIGYRGKNSDPMDPDFFGQLMRSPRYPEHDDAYYQKCVAALQAKAAEHGTEADISRIKSALG